MDYLGALPISASRSTNLAALQRPLKDLYFKWRALRNLGHSNLPGTLEINDNGLTVQYIRELHKGVQVSSDMTQVILAEGYKMEQFYIFFPSICGRFLILFLPLLYGQLSSSFIKEKSVKVEE